MKSEFDVVVVGGGGSGLAAALAAAERGLQVLLLEKNSQLGGTTGIAIGSFTANRTSLQQQANIADSATDHNADASLFAPAEIEVRNCDETRSWFLGEAGKTFEWLRSYGLAFHGPSPEPPNRVPRMHNVIPNAKAYINTLSQRLLKQGGTILCNAGVDKLNINDDGVIGVTTAEGQSYHSRHGVVLAAGDYANSSELIAKYKGSKFAEIEGINCTATGDGHLLAQMAGAELINMDITYGPEIRFVPPPPDPLLKWLPTQGVGNRIAGWLSPLLPYFIRQAIIKRLLVTWQHPENALLTDGAILINQQGQRFCNALQSPEREIALARQQDKLGYLLLDERLIEKYSAWPHFISTAPEIAYAYVKDYLKLRPDVACAGRSLAEVAAQRSVPSAALEKTVADINRVAANEQADEFGRNGNLHPLKGSRWVLLGPAKAYFTTTEGGVRVNQDLQVLGHNGAPIPGLYAVGQVGLSGQILWGHGLHIAWALTSGRLAGERIATEYQS